MTEMNDLSRSLAALEQDSTLIAVIELSKSKWLVGGLVPGVSREPLKRLDANAGAVLELLHRWRDEAVAAGRTIRRIVVAYESGREGFWLARWLRRHGIEAHVIHAASVAVSREHKRAKTDRLDIAMLKRAFLGWLRGEAKHCQMVAIPTLEEEDARRPSRERAALVSECTRIVNRVKSTMARLGIDGFKPDRRDAAERLDQLQSWEGVPVPPNTLIELRHELARLALLRAQIEEIEAARRARLKTVPDQAAAMMCRLSRVIGLGVDTADRLANEMFHRTLRDRRAVARYGALTGSPDESGARRRQKGLARAGNLRVRTAMIQFAWRFLMFQKDSALAGWYRERTAAAPALRKTLIVALARKLLIALWRFAMTGQVPEGVALRPAA